MKNEITPTSIRLSKETLDKVKEEAKKENRSVTGQIEYIIKKYFEIKGTL